MSIKSRYQFIKKKYPDYLIIFNEKNRYISCDIDKQILRYLSISDNIKNLENKNINYIVFSNITINKKYEVENNQYSYYNKLLKINNIIKHIIEE